jgi:very-short-patch-repair endonuclease
MYRGGKYCSRKCCGISQNKKIVSRCRVCGVETTTAPSQKKVYCSPDCYHVAQQSNIPKGDKSPNWSRKVVDCNNCGEQMVVIKSSPVVFCSRKCSGEYKKTPIKIKCKTCGIDMITSRKTRKFCSKHCVGVWHKSHSSNKETKIEIKIRQELTKRGIAFNQNHPVPSCRTIVDFFIEPNVCIYADGIYWHNIPKVKDRDKRQNVALNASGYIVYRFKEADIHKSVSGCINKVWEE